MLPLPNPDVICKPLDDGAVLFSTRDEVYFGLNPVGARVWALLPPASRTMDDLCEALLQVYTDAPADVIRADVTELLEELRTLGLVLAPQHAS